MTDTAVQKKSWLPPIGTPGYYVLLGFVAIFILGPLGGITAAYMNFSLGFFVGGQVLAGILGSAVTFGYGAEGKHGANYMQTMAASVAGMSGMAVLIQAMVWLGLPEPPAWQLMLYFMCIGMFGVGVGMLYTPILVDRMQLTFPSGYAVANILRALTDVKLLKRSIGQLGGGTVGGIAIGLVTSFVAKIEATGISASNVGAGMIVGARIGIAGFAMGAVGVALTPWLVSIGWLQEGEPFRKIGFIIALGMILGAAIVDLTLIFREAALRWLGKIAPAEILHVEEWQKTDKRSLILWVVFWGVAVTLCATQLMHAPLLYVLVAIALVFLFVLVNGISTGISDSNPISSAFVVTVFILAAVGLVDAGIGLIVASILLISTSSGVDMQQDRSTGWRLGTNRTIQFRFQVVGIVMGAIMSVGLARFFMAAHPILRHNLFASKIEGAEHWSSAMTYKFVGALDSLTHPKPFVMKALAVGIAIGIVTEVLRKLLKRNAAWQKWVNGSKEGFIADFLIDSAILPSPYASSFGGFVELPTVFWYAAGGCVSSAIQTWDERKKKDQPADDVPEDMSATSLVGGGLIAGDSLAALGLGIYGLLQTVL
jgi:uncharacterized oligopeptide transporter (OPT) family protein